MQSLCHFKAQTLFFYGFINADLSFVDFERLIESRRERSRTLYVVALLIEAPLVALAHGKDLESPYNPPTLCEVSLYRSLPVRKSVRDRRASGTQNPSLTAGPQSIQDHSGVRYNFARELASFCLDICIDIYR